VTPGDTYVCTVPRQKDLAQGNWGTDTGRQIFLVRHCTYTRDNEYYNQVLGKKS
jgi:hypothetical protein